jgi:TolB-like protein/Tfp pilus assembly protein PilF
MASTLRLRLLGTPAVECAGDRLGAAATQRRCLALLALLARAGPAGLSRERILVYLWPEAEADRAGHRLTQLLYLLRRDLHADALFLGSSELRLNPAAISTDLDDFRGAIERGDFQAASAAYTGPFLDGFFVDEAPEFERWVEEQREEYRRRLLGVLEALATGAARRGDLAAAAEWWRRLAAADPFSARIAVAYMEAAAAAGDRAAALQYARAYEELIREELDASPDPAIAEAAARIRSTIAPGAEQPSGPSVAVLPFVNMSPDRENEYFSDGMTEEVTTLLSRIPGVRVASRTSAFAFKAKELDARQIAERLRVTTLVEGSVRKVGNRIRLTAQLVDAAGGYQLWSETYERTLGDVFTLQQELAQAIVAALPLSSSILPPVPVVRPATTSIEAYSLYLRGRFFARKRTLEGLAVGTEYFEQALERDPAYALAHAGLAECWALRGFEEFGDLPAVEAMPRAKAAAEEAVRLDANLAEGHVIRGIVAFLYEYDWKAAEACFRRAIDLRPSYSLSHTWYAVLLLTQKRTDEALSRSRHAAELDPLALSIIAVVGLAYHYARRYEEAIATYRTILEMDPDHPYVHAWLARTLIVAGRTAEGLQAAKTAVGRLGRQPALLEILGRLLALAGRRNEALEVLNELRAMAAFRYISPIQEVGIHMGLENHAEVRRALELALEQRSGRIAFIATDPLMDPVRRKPWFPEILERAGLSS